MKLRSVRLAELSDSARRDLLHRSAVPERTIRSAAAEIVDSIRRDGDAALQDAASRFGGGARRIRQDEIEQAWEAADPALQSAIKDAAEKIRTVHDAQMPTDHEVESTPGVTVRRRWSPLRRVGGYVPGGLAAYPSTLLMIAIPATVAGVGRVAIATPGDDETNVSPALLAAARVAGVEEIHVMGGAQAIAALAFGTETIERVPKIVGPGNAWVTAAKLEVYGECDIDLPAGPSESLLLVDETADLRVVAADMACQAEHGPDSPVVVVTTSEVVADQLPDQVDAILSLLGRRDILERSLGDHGLIVLADSTNDAIDFANEYAAEHVSILTADPSGVADRLTGAGSVFVGHWAPESSGDYATGANHVLPTGGLARSRGPLSTEDFGTWRQEQVLTPGGLKSLIPTITGMADAEGLDAPRLAAEIRFQEEH